jgi:cell division initiation protein
MDEVSPALIRDVEFSTELRGFNKDEVDDFLDRVAAGVEALQQQLRQALERAARAEQLAAEAADTDQALRRTLVMAQRAADMAVAEANEEAARIRAAAEEEAAAIVARAEAEAQRVAAEAQAALRADIARLESARSALEADIAALAAYLDGERARLRRQLAEQIERIEALGTPAPAPAVHEIELPPEPSAPPPEAEPAEAAGREEVEPAGSEPPPGAEDSEGAGGDTASVEVEARANHDAAGEGREAPFDLAALERDDDELFGRPEDFPDELDFDRSWWRRRRR